VAAAIVTTVWPGVYQAYLKFSDDCTTFRRDIQLTVAQDVLATQDFEDTIGTPVILDDNSGGTAGNH